MSTKAIREAIDALVREAPTGCPIVADIAGRARAEVEAIEKAAEVLAFEVTSQVEFHNRQLTMAVTLMREIADAAPKHKEKA